MKNFARTFMSSLLTAFLSVFAVIAVTAEDGVTFKVRIENISKGEVLKLSNGGAAPFALSPGLWVVHSGNASLFAAGEKDRGQGLETQSEDGNPEALAASVKGRSETISSGVFNTPVGTEAAGPVVPGGAFEFAFTANPGAILTFTTMFGQSNDLFYAPEDEGIALFGKKGKPVGGDITGKIKLWDVGTEINQEPGSGPDQGPRQSAPNTGAVENGVVRTINTVRDGFSYPKTTDVMRVTITPEGNRRSSMR